MKFQSGNVYEGEWQNDRFHGKGVLKGGRAACAA
jgi:hypothetical protein